MNNKACILVTGASSGIGKATVRRLSNEHFKVFAGVRNQLHGDRLVEEIGHNVIPVILDVTDMKSLEKAFKEVEKNVGDNGLNGLVNNAGIGVFGPLEFMPMHDFRRQFDVNVFGLLSVTQAFLPLIRKGMGRIINIGSIGDRLTMPFAGALCASKHAVASINEALRQELYPFKIDVCLIEPASIKTEAVDKLLDENDKHIENMSSIAKRYYGEIFRDFTKIAANMEKEHGSNPSVVADTVLRALTDKKAKTRYLCGKNSIKLAMLSKIIPEKTFDGIRRKIFGIPNKFKDE